jgi:hypothetical protein
VIGVTGEVLLGWAAVIAALFSGVAAVLGTLNRRSIKENTAATMETKAAVEEDHGTVGKLEGAVVNLAEIARLTNGYLRDQIERRVAETEARGDRLLGESEQRQAERDVER